VIEQTAQGLRFTTALVRMCGRAARFDRPARRPARPAVARGLTLVELLVTMTIAAILLAIGVPMLQNFVATNQLATSANDVIAALNLARAEAVRCGLSIDVTLNYGSGTDARWTVASCSNPVGVPMRVGQFSDAQLSLGGLTPVTVPPTASPTLTFDSQGRLASSAPGGVYGVVICHGGALKNGSGQSSSRAVLIAPTGRIKIAPVDPTLQTPMKNPTTPVTDCTTL